MAIKTRRLTARDWDVVEKLFGENGACGGCWCMYWRLPRGGKLWEESKGKKNRKTMRQLVTGGQVRAVLAFDGDKPVGWCAYGPRSDFPRLQRVRALPQEYSRTTWSVVCFFIDKDYRRQGVATQLLQAATREAFRAGATEVEGYPIKPKSDRVSPAFAWTGVESLFESCGYTKKLETEASTQLYLRTK